MLQLGDNADDVRTTTQPARVIVGYGDGTLVLIEPVTRRRLPNIRLHGHPEGSAVIRDERQILVNVPGGAELVVVDVGTTAQIASWTLGDARRNCPLVFDAAAQVAWVATRQRQRLDVVCVSGFIDVWESKTDSYGLVDYLATIAGARTGLLVPALDRLCLAVRAAPQAAAPIRVYRPAGATHGH